MCGAWSLLKHGQAGFTRECTGRVLVNGRVEEREQCVDVGGKPGLREEPPLLIADASHERGGADANVPTGVTEVRGHGGGDQTGLCRCHERSAGGLGQYPGSDGSDRHRFVGQLRKCERWRNGCSCGGRVGSCRSMKVSFRGCTMCA